MNKLDINTLSPAEKLIYSIAATYLNEITFIRSTSGRMKKTSKKVKNSRKQSKARTEKLKIGDPTPFHAFEALLGTLKMKTIAYLKMECSPTQIREWIYGMTHKGAELFINDMREPMCYEIIDILKGHYRFRVSYEVHQWLFKSGFMKRSTNIFKEAYKDGINFSYSEDIVALRNKYLDRGYEVIQNADFESTCIDPNVLAREWEMSYLIEISATYEALNIIVKDIKRSENIINCDETTLKRAKYLTTQVKTLIKIMTSFINETSNDLDETERILKESKNITYRKQFEPFKDILTLSCALSNIEFTKEYENEFIGYYETLKGYSQKELNKELFWLKGEIAKVG